MKKRILGQYELEEEEGDCWQCTQLIFNADPGQTSDDVVFRPISKIEWTHWDEAKIEKMMIFLHEFGLCLENCSLNMKRLCQHES